MLSIMNYTLAAHLKTLETFVVFYCTCCITLLCDAGGVRVCVRVCCNSQMLISALSNRFEYPGTLSLRSSPAKYECNGKRRGKTLACEMRYNRRTDQRYSPSRARR